MNKKTILTIAGLTLALGSAFTGISKVYADEDKQNIPTMMQRMTERFGLNREEVEIFMREERETRQMERGKGMEERLNQAVNEGSLTEDQRVTILAKMDEICDGAGSHRGELRDWAEENGINLRELNFGRFGEGKESRMGEGFTR